MAAILFLRTLTDKLTDTQTPRAYIGEEALGCNYCYAHFLEARKHESNGLQLYEGRTEAYISR